MLDDAPAPRAHRALVALLRAEGFAVEVLSGTDLAGGPEADPDAWLAARGISVEASSLRAESGGPQPRWAYPPAHLRLDRGGTPIHLLRGPATRGDGWDDVAQQAFLFLLDVILGHFRPDVLVAHGVEPPLGEALRRGRDRGLATAVLVPDAAARDALALASADVAIAPSAFVAEYHHEAAGRLPDVLPELVDAARIVAPSPDPRYLTLFAAGGGLAPAARIAEGLARARPDVPVMVVADPAGVAALGDGALDREALGRVLLMPPTADPRGTWRATRLALLPSLDALRTPEEALGSLLNGVPAVASDRGGLPEILGAAGTMLPLPGRLTPATREVPTAEEVAPWVEAALRLWDDAGLYDARRRLAREIATRRAPEATGPRYLSRLGDIRPTSGPRPPDPTPSRRAASVVLVPHLAGIEPECEEGLRVLERAGVRVVRRRGCSQIDLARSEMASDALHDGAEAFLFIDADIGFDPPDALHLLARSEPVVSGVYAKKGCRELASIFAEGIGEVVLGPAAPGPYPLRYAATGFLRVRCDVLRRLVDALELPLCNTRWGRGFWPFFLSLIVPDAGGHHFLGEDWAFSHRLAQVGITPLADTTIRLRHIGAYSYGWEDAGADREAGRSYRFRP